MRLPRDVTPQELIRALATYGYQVTRQTGSHLRVTTQRGGQHHEVIPNHKAIRVGTLQSILVSVARHQGITVQELVARLRL